nr:PREDICTED: uncharacterized protein LOC105672111 [Linepithema humile]
MVEASGDVGETLRLKAYILSSDSTIGEGVLNWDTIGEDTDTDCARPSLLLGPFSILSSTLPGHNQTRTKDIASPQRIYPQSHFFAVKVKLLYRGHCVRGKKQCVEPD